MRVKYYTRLEQLPQLSPEERESLSEVEKKFKFRTNEYYLSLINWADPADPIRRIAIPNLDELEEWGKLDASKEAIHTKLRGVQHKYSDTALFLVTNVCGTFCRFCFRKRLFTDRAEVLDSDISSGIDYIRQHKEITNVLLTGGDPLILSTDRLDRIVSQLRKIKHVGIIRLGSKIPASNPYRILDDPSLADLIRRHSHPERRIYIITQFNHPREITDIAIGALDTLRRAGAVLSNQTPLMRGINDDPDVLAELLRKLSFVGNPPYYVFQVRPTLGNKPFALPLVRTYQIFQKAIAQLSGLAKRVRLIMSHATGKIEIMGIVDGKLLLRYHRAAKRDDEGRVMMYNIKPDAYWLEGLDRQLAELSPNDIPREALAE